MSNKRMSLNVEELKLLAQAARENQWWFARTVLGGNDGKLRHEGAALAIEYLICQEVIDRPAVPANLPENGGGQ